MQKTLLLFDVDGTLTEPRKKAPEKMIDMLKNLQGIKEDLMEISLRTVC